MKRVLGILFLVFYFASIHSATQVPDICIIRKDTARLDTLVMFSYPLEDYFEKIGTRNLAGFKTCESPACSRGYQAVWLVENDSLFLINIQGCNEHMSWCDEAAIPNLKKIFGEASKQNKVFASWAYGSYRCFEGDVIPHLKNQMFVADRVLNIKQGELKKEKRYVNVIKKSKSFAVEENTPEFVLSIIQTNINWNALPKRGPKQFVVDIQLIIQKNRKTQIQVKTNASKRNLILIETELLRCLKKFKWYKYKQLGKNVSVSFNIKAEFDIDNKLITIIK